MKSRFTAILGFFGLRVAAALTLLKLSASALSVTDFAVLAQLLAYCALLNLVAMAGSQNGLIRQAAAAQGEGALNRLHSSGLLLWFAVVPLTALAVLLAGASISRILVGNAGQREVVLILTWMALLAAPGQIWTSILSGRQRTAESLGAQAAGLVAGTVGALWFVLRNEVEMAAIAFACGPFVAAAIAFIFVRRHLARLVFDGALIGEAMGLLRYSAAFALVAGTGALSIFALRSIYRDAFGPVALGHWMAANRISDLSTQLLGLFMLQYFVPQLAGMGDGAQRRSFIMRCGLGATAVMALPLLVFLLAPEMLVRIFLSDAYLPAIPVIKGYMLGDMLRVWASLAMFTAFANGKPGRYAAIELAALAVMASVMIALVLAGYQSAPRWAYLTGYGSVALVVLAVLVTRRRQAATASITAETA